MSSAAPSSKGERRSSLVDDKVAEAYNEVLAEMATKATLLPREIKDFAGPIKQRGEPPFISKFKEELGGTSFHKFDSTMTVRGAVELFNKKQKAGKEAEKQMDPVEEFVDVDLGGGGDEDEDEWVFV